MKQYSQLAISNPDDLRFGYAPHPVSCPRGLRIGSGLVYPEINFTLPPMKIEEGSWPAVERHYRDMLESILRRTRALDIPGLVMEYELLPPMTDRPQWGADITALLRNGLDTFSESTKIPTALRVTVTDLRDGDRPPLLRSGRLTEKMLESFEKTAAAGADILSIESVGGKEVHDQALLQADIPGICAALGILSSRDMEWLWSRIVDISARNGIIAGGDTACGFANTAMQLAGQGMIPSVLAALDRVATVPRSLIAFAAGAQGPSKDCAYEGPFMKAIAGVPVSMEGRSACCAHFSPIGNISGYAADLWSNESVQNIRLLSGSAPEAFTELLGYDCRLYNSASPEQAKNYRDLLIRSDVSLSPEAFVLAPENVISLSRTAIEAGSDPYAQTRAILTAGFDLLQKGAEEGQVRIREQELSWLGQFGDALSQIPEDESSALAYLIENYSAEFRPESYGL